MTAAQRGGRTNARHPGPGRGDQHSAPVAVAVVSWNTRGLLARCLRSLRDEARSDRADVWVVDNGSTDGSVEMVREEFPWVHLLTPGRNLGFGSAVNAVARRTRSAWIAPSNADVELQPGALELLLDAGSRHPEAGIVAPALILPEGRVQQSVWPFPSVRLALLTAAGIHRLSERAAGKMLLEGHWDQSVPREVDYAMGAFLLVRRDAFERVGGFPERQWLYAEDLDLAWRMSQAGWRTRYEPRARVAHAGGAATSVAFGPSGAELLTVAAAYEWMGRRRGAVAKCVTAASVIVGAVVRLALLEPLAMVAPSRWAARRHSVRGWLRTNLAALRQRRPGLPVADSELREPVPLE